MDLNGNDGQQPSRNRPDPNRWTTAAFAFASFVLALIGFVTGRYRWAPGPDRVTALASASEDRLKWHFLGNVLEAAELNQATLRFKTSLFAAAACSLLGAFALLGGYSLYRSLG